MTPRDIVLALVVGVLVFLVGFVMWTVSVDVVPSLLRG